MLNELELEHKSAIYKLESAYQAKRRSLIRKLKKKDILPACLHFSMPVCLSVHLSVFGPSVRKHVRTPFRPSYLGEVSEQNI